MGRTKKKNPRAKAVRPSYIRDAIIRRMHEVGPERITPNALYERVRLGEDKDPVVRSHLYDFLDGTKEMSNGPLEAIMDNLGIVLARHKDGKLVAFSRLPD